MIHDDQSAVIMCKQTLFQVSRQPWLDKRTEGSAVFPQEFPALPFPLLCWGKLLRGGIPLGLEQRKAALGSYIGFVW